MAVVVVVVAECVKFVVVVQNDVTVVVVVVVNVVDVVVYDYDDDVINQIDLNLLYDDHYDLNDDYYVHVNTGLGEIVGKRLIIEQVNRYVDQFLGIPYAQPPIDEQRFRRPQPIVDGYDQKPLMALNWPSNCRQIAVPKFNEYSVYLNQTFQEDCLYLNIWSPSSLDNAMSSNDDQCDQQNCDNQQQQQQQKLRPVFVYFHGGCFLYGGSSLPLYDGRIFAAMTDALIVTVNFR